MGLRLNRAQGFRPKLATGIAVSVIKCRDCGLIYSDPQPLPSSLADHYAVEADDYFSPSYFEDDVVSIDDATAKRLTGGGGKVLDIGSGVGKAMRALQRQGWDAWGIEPSEQFARFAVERGTPADRIQIASVEDATFEPDTFDLITFGAVLEHLPAPAAMLARVLPWLRPGGIIHAEVPSSRWIMAKLVNAYFALRGVNLVTNLSPMHPPYHLFEFSHRSFERHGQRCGYTVAQHNYWTGDMPQLPHRLMKPFMHHTGTGMQLTVWLRRN